MSHEVGDYTVYLQKKSNPSHIGWLYIVIKLITMKDVINIHIVLREPILCDALSLVYFSLSLSVN